MRSHGDVSFAALVAPHAGEIRSHLRGTIAARGLISGAAQDDRYAGISLPEFCRWTRRTPAVALQKRLALRSSLGTSRPCPPTLEDMRPRYSARQAEKGLLAV